MGRLQARAAMVVVTLLWSIAGIVSRQLESAQALEVSFWRSAANALALTVLLAVFPGPAKLLASLRQASWVVWASGFCWAVMFTAFMTALMVTTVAQVLLIMALGPLFTALLARWALKEPLSARTVVACAVAGIGIAAMQAPDWWAEWQSASVGKGVWWGSLAALAVPTAGAVNWVLIRTGMRSAVPDSTGMVVGLWLGAVLSAAWAVPFAWPLQATSGDVAWLALLGVFQLALPCWLAIRVSRTLPPTEVALLALLEVVFGVAWAWWGTSESPSWPVVMGGSLVLAAVAVHAVGPRREPASAAAGAPEPAKGCARG